MTKYALDTKRSKKTFQSTLVNDILVQYNYYCLIISAEFDCSKLRNSYCNFSEHNRTIPTKSVEVLSCQDNAHAIVTNNFQAFMQPQQIPPFSSSTILPIYHFYFDI